MNAPPSSRHVTIRRSTLVARWLMTSTVALLMHSYTLWYSRHPCTMGLRMAV